MNKVMLMTSHVLDGYDYKTYL